jgi:hypothetical protein
MYIKLKIYLTPTRNYIVAKNNLILRQITETRNNIKDLAHETF